MRLVLLPLLLSALAAPLVAQHAVQSRDGELVIIAGEHGPRVSDRKGFSNPMSLPEEVRIQSLAAIRSGWVAAGDQPVGDRRDLYLRLLDAGGLKRLPTPAFQRHPIRTEPIVLTRDGGIVGLAWLEGENRESLRVRASHWLGITWSQPLALTDDGAPAALALDAVLLPDGSWLLVWAGFDGEDDEIYVSLLLGDGFTAPQALTDNQVPDILPTVTAAGDRVVLAWNQYDGREYRVLVTQLVEGRWSEARAEAAGTFEPLLLLRDAAPHLLFLSHGGGAPSWHLHQLDEHAQAVRRAVVPAPSNRRPLVRDVEGTALLEWPGEGLRQPLVWSDVP